MRIGQLIAGQHARVDGADVIVTALAYDSRAVVPGTLFAAFEGSAADGHDYVDAALEAGAVAVLCERPVDTGSATRVVVADARQALARMAARFYGDPHRRMRTLGVTGTNGKTTTVHLIESILREAGFVPGVIGTLGTRYVDRRIEAKLTTPESVDLMALLAEMVQAGADSLAMEVSSHALTLGRVAGLDFNVGVFTNLSHDHLDFHGTLDAYFAAKAQLLRTRLKPGGWRVINNDDERVRTLYEGRCLSFSASDWELADVRASSVRVGADGCRMGVGAVSGDFDLHSPLLGRFNVENVLAAATAALALNVDPAHIQAGVANLRAVSGRLEPVSVPGEPLVLVDYAHTPDALEKALATVREVARGRLLCVFGCGGNRDPHKRQPMGEVVGRAADHAIITNDNPRTEAPEAIAAPIETGLRAVGVAPATAAGARTYAVTLDRAQAIRDAVSAAKPGDAVLIAGKGHEAYQLVGDEKRDFDDREHARAALGRADHHHAGGGAMSDESWYVVPARLALRGSARSNDGEESPPEHTEQHQGCDGPLLYIRSALSRRRQRQVRAPLPQRQGKGLAPNGEARFQSVGAAAGTFRSGSTPRDAFGDFDSGSPEGKSRGPLDGKPVPRMTPRVLPLLELLPSSLRLLPAADDEAGADSNKYDGPSTRVSQAES